MNNFLKIFTITSLILSISGCAGVDKEKFLSSLPKSNAESILLLSDCNYVQSISMISKQGVCSLSKNGLNVYKNSNPDSRFIALNYDEIDSMNLIKSSSFLGDTYSITIVLKSNKSQLGFRALAVRKGNEKGFYDSNTLNEFTEKYYSLLKENGVRIDVTLTELEGEEWGSYDYIPTP